MPDVTIPDTPAASRSSRTRLSGLPKLLAIGLGQAWVPPELAGRLRAAQIDSISRLTPVAMAACCLCGIILLNTLHAAGRLDLRIIGWFILLFGLAAYYVVFRLFLARRSPSASASRRAIHRVILHGVLLGALWGAVPVLAFEGAPPSIQLFIGCLMAGMMCAGAFVLGAIPAAGLAYVSMIAAGAIATLVRSGTEIDYSLAALLLVYTAVIVTNLTWNAQLFVEHYIAAARLKNEIAERERTHSNVVQAQRMAALGQLASGIAHDFNNILQAIASSAVTITHRAQDGGQVRRLAARIMEAADRGGSISRRLLAFALHDTLNDEAIDPADLLTSAHELLRPTFDVSIGFRLEAAPGLPHLRADRAQLDTVLVNITANARDAMPYGGLLTLRASAELFARDSENPPLRAGQYVRISVIDTGIGMDEATLARATEPFFTTKPQGRGAGLGLSMARAFAEQSGGALAIESAPARGTTVTIWLPRTDAPVVASPSPPPLSFLTQTTWRPHILLVDDDELVRETLIESLTGYGFMITCVEDANAALEHIDRGKTVDVLVTDFSMPGMNGVDLIRAVQARRPGLAAILLTGHVGDIASPNGEAVDTYVLLRKPVRAAELAQHFATALQAAA